MKFLEKDLEQIIFDADRDELEKRGLSISGKIYRQLKIGRYGIADLVSFNREYDSRFQYLNITIYELKKDLISSATFAQACRYVYGIREYFEKRSFSFKIGIKIVLIGASCSSDLFWIKSTYPISEVSCDELIEFYKYEYSVDGISFDDIYYKGSIND